jgi:hypothetical protein
MIDRTSARSARPTAGLEVADGGAGTVVVLVAAAEGGLV